MIDFPDDYGKNESEQKTEIVSKSELKREMSALQKMGEELVELPNKQLDKIVMPEKLLDAIMLARRLEHREGRRRQLQFIGKLMRETDITDIKNQLEIFQQQSRGFRQHFHKLEEWRDRLIAEGDSAINELLVEQPNIDRHQLRQLIRQAQKEQSQQKPPAASRKLFKYLRDVFES